MMQQLKIQYPPETKDQPEKMTPEEFFKWQSWQEERYELVDGVPYLPLKMQAGTSLNHDKVTMNALGHAFNQLRGKSCRPCTADVAIQIPAGNIRYPDMSIDCGEWKAKDKTAQNPWLVLEVFSPSTRLMDSVLKVEEYKTVPSLRAILLVDTLLPHVTVYTRDDFAQTESPTLWDQAFFTNIETVLEFPVPGLVLPLGDLYEGVQFEGQSREKNLL